MEKPQNEEGRELKFSELEIGQEIVGATRKVERITSNVRGYLTTITQHVRGVLLEVHYLVTQSDDGRNNFLRLFGSVPIYEDDKRHPILSAQLEGKV
jgi:hypothetical protein